MQHRLKRVQSGRGAQEPHAVRRQQRPLGEAVGRRLEERAAGAYLGSERSGGKPGRGSENKFPFVVAVQTIGPNHKPHRVCLAQIPHWLAEVRSFCSHHMQRPLTVAVLDIGANMGYHTVKPGSKIANGGRLHAFEPNPEVHAVCLENSKINGLLGMFRSVTSRSVTCPERPCRAARTATCSPPTCWATNRPTIASMW
jgi:hypothetical protein